MKRKTMNKTKNKENYLLYGLLAIAAIVLVFSIVSFLNFQSDTSNQQLNEMHSASQMSLTAFDKQLARNLMDKNNDGLCDACGMDVNACIDSGQLQCNMDPKSTIGIIGSEHAHANFKVYINENELRFNKNEFYMKSSFIHVDPHSNADYASGVLHKHATGVPLWIFFESIGMKFNKDCLKLPDRQKFCNDDKRTLKFYVNSQPNNEWENYVFRESDKILISYGNETDLTEQLNSITNFANDHEE